MRATVYHLYEQIGVCLLESDEGAFVGECEVRHDDDVRVLKHSLRPVLQVLHLELETLPASEPDVQEIVDRATLGVVRFRNRLSAINKSSLSDARTDALLDEAHLAMLDLAELRAACS